MPEPHRADPAAPNAPAAPSRLAAALARGAPWLTPKRFLFQAAVLIVLSAPAAVAVVMPAWRRSGWTSDEFGSWEGLLRFWLPAAAGFAGTWATALALPWLGRATRLAATASAVVGLVAFPLFMVLFAVGAAGADPLRAQWSVVAALGAFGASLLASLELQRLRLRSRLGGAATPRAPTGLRSVAARSILMLAIVPGAAAWSMSLTAWLYLDPPSATETPGWLRDGLALLALVWIPGAAGLTGLAASLHGWDAHHPRERRRRALCVVLGLAPYAALLVLLDRAWLPFLLLTCSWPAASALALATALAPRPRARAVSGTLPA